MIFRENEVVLFQGDSITDGGRGRGTTDPNHFIGHSFPYILSAALSYQYMDRNPAFYSRGVSGDDALQMYARWREDAINLKPTIISILIGVNDAHKWCRGCGSSPQQYRTILKMTIEETKQALDGVRFILCEPFYFPNNADAFSQSVYEEILVRQRIIRELSKEYDCVFVPLQEELESYAEKLGDRRKILWDGVHPTLLGHSIVSQKWLEVTGL